MTHDQAVFLRDFLLQSHEYEASVTPRVLAAVPGGKLDYKADPKSRSAGEVAWHIAVSEKLFLDGITKGEFVWEEGAMPEARSGKELAEWYAANIPAAVARVRALDGEALTKIVPFFGMFHLPAVAYLNFMLNHTIHHRGQLAGWLRAMGGAVPSIYGGSADEPMQG
jgi:uncharacterized damage-inducible protein DinB